MEVIVSLQFDVGVGPEIELNTLYRVQVQDALREVVADHVVNNIIDPRLKLLGSKVGGHVPQRHVFPEMN